MVSWDSKDEPVVVVVNTIEPVGVSGPFVGPIKDVAQMHHEAGALFVIDVVDVPRHGFSHSLLVGGADARIAHGMEDDLAAGGDFLDSRGSHEGLEVHDAVAGWVGEGNPLVIVILRGRARRQSCPDRREAEGGFGGWPRNQFRAGRIGLLCFGHSSCEVADTFVLLIRPFELHVVAGYSFEVPGANIANLSVVIALPSLARSGVGDGLAHFV